MTKRILIILGHPYDASYNSALADAYAEGAKVSGAEVQQIRVGQLLFNPNLAFGYSKRIEMEPDLADAQKKITWANHLVWIHPLWWGGMPAILKGFIDRIFIPGFSHKYREDSIWWDKLLKNKSAHIICTADQPYWYYWLVYKKPGINELKKMTLQFAGINPVKTTFIGPIRKSSDKFRISWLEKVKKLGLKNL